KDRKKRLSHAWFRFIRAHFDNHSGGLVAMVRLLDAPDKEAPLSNRPVIPGEDGETASTGCPLTAAIRAIGGKWNLICLYWLETETRRFNELRRLMPDISHKVLTETLRNLEEEDLIVRTVHSLAPSHVEYEISEHGKSVLP